MSSNRTANGFYEKFLALEVPVYWKLSLLAAFPLVVFYFTKRSKSKTIDIKQFAHFPQPEPADSARGHWPWIEKSAGLGDPRRSFAMQDLAPLVGSRSLVTLDGDEWKGLRKRILPGFQPQHLLSLVKVILDKTQIFVEHLEKRAASGDESGIDELTTNLAFDVIGIVTFDVDLNAQVPGQQSDILLTYRALSQAYVARDMMKPWWRRYFTENERTVRSLDRKLDTLLKKAIQKEHEKLISGSTTASRSVAALSLSGMDALTPELLQQTSDTCRGFLFAGHDTTSILLQWSFYELHRRPSALETLGEELDEVFGVDPSPAAVMAQLSGPENGKLLARLPYTDAIIKETLRVHPPGTTARVSPEGAGTTLTLPDGQQLLVDGLCLSPRAYIIQRDPKIFGETKDDWMPERWLGPEAANIPESAWRPYERGPRRCTGSELANMEAKIVLACIARHFDFIKVELGELDLDGEGKPEIDEKGFYRTKSTLFSTDQVTAKPVDGMKMRVKIRERK
ncbi:hypothetical protein TruAng_002065 [Truncatella angustata]|nr:hypothetical protein TruAng_002065 [Truncatella angustata]